MKKVTETQIEMAICDALTMLGYFVVKLKDQSAFRDGSYRRGSKYQIKGVSDLVVYGDLGKCIWIEVKTATGVQSEAQKAFEKRITDLGHTYLMVRSVKEAVDAVHQGK